MLISGRFRWISPAGCSCRGYGAQYELYGIASCRWLPAACLRSADASCICPFAHCNRRSTVCREWKQSCELRLPLLHLNSLRNTTVTATSRSTNHRYPVQLCDLGVESSRACVSGHSRVGRNSVRLRMDHDLINTRYSKAMCDILFSSHLTVVHFDSPCQLVSSSTFICISDSLPI
jgi:hypothetical protein